MKENTTTCIIMWEAAKGILRKKNLVAFTVRKGERLNVRDLKLSLWNRN